MRRLSIIYGGNRRNYSDTFTGREIIFLLLFAIITTIALDLIFYPNTLDDSYITFRYSKHLAGGYGLCAWNINGECIEGYTSLLWMLLLGLSDFMGFDIVVLSKVLGILAHIIMVSVLIISPFHKKNSINVSYDLLENPNETILAGIFLSFYLPLSYYSTSGMETLLFTTLIILFFTIFYLPWNRPLLIILTIFLILIRPEGVLVVGLGVLFLWLKGRNAKLHPYVRTIAVTLLVAMGALVSYRLILFGDIVPNTYRAKVDGATLLHIQLGAGYVLDWVQAHLIINCLSLIGALILFFTISKNKVGSLPVNFLYIVFLLLSYILYIIRVGGDSYSAFPYWRHFVQLIPLISLLFSYSIAYLFFWSRYLQLFVLLSCIIITNLSLFGLESQSYSLETMIQKSLQHYPALALPSHNPYYLWLKKISHDSTTIASSLAGELPYVVDAQHIDILGLNSQYIAKHGTFDPQGPQDSKTDMDWVLEQRPDIIEGYVSAKVIISGYSKVIGGRYQMTIGLLSSPIFQKDYCFVQNGPYNYIDRAIFINKNYLESLNNKQELKCIPIEETILRIYRNKKSISR